MSFRSYDSYRASEVGWLGDVPSTWEVRIGRRLFKQMREPAREADEQLSATQRYGVVPQRLFMELEDQKVVLALSGLSNFKHVQRDDFVISLRSFQGGIEHSEYSGCVSPAYTVLRACGAICPDYFAYTMKCSSFVSALQTTTEGIRDGKNISYEQFGSIPLPVPPLSEQTAIAAFLDCETAKIDILVEDQQRLLELLQEKRQAVICHAVTKGVALDAPMQESGIEWLGEVPKHWQVLKGGKLGELFGSELIREEDVAEVGETPYLKVASLSVDSFDIGDCDWYVTGVTVLARKDFIAFPKRGAAILSNKVAIVAVPAFLDPNLMGWAIRPPHSLRYFAYMLKARRIETLADVSTVPQINNKHIAPEKFPVPPAEEQREVVDFLDAQVAEIDGLRGAALKAIELLKERRAVLISAAVTGKIDVREVTEAGSPIAHVVAA